jgi:predicted ATP-grasp superfamily ATP-dependent carboligase
VLGGGITAAAVLALLARADVPTYTVAPVADFVRKSRWYRSLPASKPEPSVDNTEKFLRQLPLERAVLMPCSDDWALAVAALPDDLKLRFPCSGPSFETTSSFIDKWQFAQTLEREGIPHPHTQLIRSFTELSDLPKDRFTSAILKPLSSVEFARKHGVKGFVVGSQDEALRAMTKAEFPIMLQEFIPGAPSSGYFLDGFVERSGRVSGLLARRRLRMSPPKLGNSTLMVSVPLREVKSAADSLTRLLAALNYRGTFSAEFKFDERDGVFKLFEINARPWWYVEFAASCGVNVCTLAYQDALGVPLQPVTDYKVGRRCVFFVHDLRAWREQRGSRPSLWSWIKPWFGADSTPFHWNDPAPAIAYARKLIRENKAKRLREKSEEMQQRIAPVPAKLKTSP